MKGLIISGCFIELSKPDFLDLTSFLQLEWLYQQREEREMCLFPLSSTVSCSWDILRVRRVNTKCQHLSILIESQLAAGGCSKFFCFLL